MRLLSIGGWHTIIDNEDTVVKLLLYAKHVVGSSQKLDQQEGLAFAIVFSKIMNLGIMDNYAANFSVS